jgi:hypothetical protein
MIIDEYIITGINYINIEYYKSIGYSDIKCNQKVEVRVDQLPLESNLKINVKCDICGDEKLLSYQKYNKNVRKYNLYTCNTSCAQFKNKLTLKELYGIENFNRAEENKLKTKERYDKITKEIEDSGYIKCSKCLSNNDISHYIKNLNGRYKKVCRSCRSKQSSNNRRSKDMTDFNKTNYIKNKHIYAWRNLLKNYLNRKSLLKTDSTFNMLGYSQYELKSYLESLFIDDMNWSNYGSKWQIDHIIPVSLFKEDTPPQIVNSLENLRPLYKSYNNMKSNKIDESSITIIDKYKTYLKIQI